MITIEFVEKYFPDHITKNKCPKDWFSITVDILGDHIDITKTYYVSPMIYKAIKNGSIDSNTSST